MADLFTFLALIKMLDPVFDISGTNDVLSTSCGGWDAYKIILLPRQFFG